MNLLIQLTWICIVAFTSVEYIIGQDTTDDKSLTPPSVECESCFSILRNEYFNILENQKKILALVKGKYSTVRENQENIKRTMGSQYSTLLAYQRKIIKFVEDNSFRCPHGFIPYVEKKSCYVVSDVLKSWNNARAHCQDYGGDLVSIESKLEHMFLKDRVLGRHFNAYELWTSGTDSSREGYFIWRGTSRSFIGTYSKWLPGEPNNVVGGEDCCTVRGPKLDFNDRPCGNSYRFICEINL